ncbi:MAG: hypothetical protein WBA11_13030 [Rubrivirga sp.]
MLLFLATAASAQITVGGDVSVGPSLTTLGASGTIEAAGIPVPIGTVEFPTSIGLDARARLEVRGETWGGRVGVGYLSASDIFDGAAILGQTSVDIAFALASGEVTVRQPYGPGVLVAGVGPEVRVVLEEGSEREGLLGLLGDVRRSHLAVGASLGLEVETGGVKLRPEVRGGLSLTPFSDDQIEVFGGNVQLGGDFRFNHVSASLTVGV